MNKDLHSEHQCQPSFQTQVLVYTAPQVSLIHLQRPLSLLVSFSIPGDWEDIEEGYDLDKGYPGLEY